MMKRIRSIVLVGAIGAAWVVPGCQPTEAGKDDAGGNLSSDMASGGAGDMTGGGNMDLTVPTEKFSFFVTSLQALQQLSNNPNGFGGDLRFGETGPGAGLRGADKICTTIAERSMPGAGRKRWRAFLSATAGEDGAQVNAIDRIGDGPWYDRLGRVFAMNKAGLLSVRPQGDAMIINDFPNEDGVPNHRPDVTKPAVDNHDMLTGTNRMGQLYGATFTCLDWTSNSKEIAVTGRPRCGHSWPRMVGSNEHWMDTLTESGCGASVQLVERGGPGTGGTGNTVGDGGGYGGFYCFALTP